MEDYQELSIDQLFQQNTTEAPIRIIWKSKTQVPGERVDPIEKQLIHIAGSAINVVAARDVRMNVRRSLRIAVDLAATGSRVLYLNSYAGTGFLADILKSELARHTDAEQQGIRERVAIFTFLPGLIAQNAGSLQEHLYEEAWSDEADDLYMDVKRDVVILNSFEFATFSYREKVQLSSTMLGWTEEVPITIVVFTQEVYAQMEAGIPVRGPIGLLMARAKSVSKLDLTEREKKTAELQELSVPL